jgi:heat shock protein HslJ
MIGWGFIFAIRTDIRMKYAFLLLLAALLACGQADTTNKATDTASTESATAAPSAGTDPAPAAANTPEGTTAPVAGEAPATAAPSAQAPATSGPKASLAGTYWRMIALNGKPMAGQTAKEMYLLLDPSSPQFKGHSGCNTVIGEAKRGTGNQLWFINMITTTMDCKTPAIEAEFTQALEGIRSYTIQGNMLALSLADGKVAMTLEAR